MYNNVKKVGTFRSGLEKKIADTLKKLKVKFRYEQDKIRYHKPVSYHTYLPDFVLPNGIIIEAKGRFTSPDRKKHLLLQQQYPHLDIRFVFSNSNSKLSKTSNTTYGSWCDKHGFEYADKEVPKEWIKEKKKEKGNRL